MALPSIDLTGLLRLNARQREEHFMRFARRMPDAPKNSEWTYQIRIGGTTLHDADTYQLRLKFEAEVKKLRRKHGVRVCRDSK